MTAFFRSNLHDRGKPLSEPDIAAFEAEIGAPLPADYRSLLLAANGGRFYKPMRCKMKDAGYSSEVGISRLFIMGSLPDEKYLTTQDNFKAHKGRIPLNTLPIGDAYDDLLLLDLGARTPGAALLWVRDDELTKDREKNRLMIASSFAELMQGCELDSSFFLRDETMEPFVAVSHYDLHALRRLLDNGLDPDMRNERGTPLLVKACELLDIDAAALLLEHGADPNLPDGRGVSSLWAALVDSGLDLMRLLIQAGAHRRIPHDPSKSFFDVIDPPPTGRVAEILREDVAP